MPTVSPRTPHDDSTSEVTLISPSFEGLPPAQWRKRLIAALVFGMLAGLVLGLLVFGVLR